MSRTFRRKNFEDTRRDSCDNSGRKTAGYYTQYEIVGHVVMTWEGELSIVREIDNRPPTRDEYFRKYWRNHSDSVSNRWGPGRSYRKRRSRENRRINKQELRRWMTSDDYEPLFENKPRDCWWDWC